MMKSKHGMKSRKKNTFMSIMLSVVLLVTLTPAIAFTSPAHAAEEWGSDWYKQKMQEYQAKIDELTPLYNQAVTTEANALKTMNTAKSTMDGYKTTIDNAEPTLNKKTREYIDKRIKESFAKDLPNFKTKKRALYDYQNNFYKPVGGFDSYWSRMMYSEAIINAMEKQIKNSDDPDYYVGQWSKRWLALEKRNPGMLRETFYHVLSYENVLTALNQIDECNRIRANKNELAKYWTGVKGQEVPAGIKQLKVNPYLMVTSAVNATTNLEPSWPLDHVFGCVGRGGDRYRWTIPWSDTEGQNIARTSSPKPALPWGGWWTRENDAKMDEHNSNIADPSYTQCGFAYVKYWDKTGLGGSFHDFVGVDDSIWPGITVSDYRNGLKAYCGSTIQTWENAKANYSSAVTAYDNAVKAYNTAKKNTETQLLRLNNAKSDYNLMKERYERAIQREAEYANKTYTVTFKAKLWTYDSEGTLLDKQEKEISKETVIKGGSCDYPVPPTYDGYDFNSWGSTPTNVLGDMTVNAYYYKFVSTSDEPVVEEPVIEEPPMQYTVTFIRSYDASVMKTITVNAGQNIIVPNIDCPDKTYEANGYVYANGKDLKNVQQNLIFAVEYFKRGDPTETVVFHESIVKPDGYGPVTIKPATGDNTSGSNGKNESRMELVEDDPTTPTTKPTTPAKPSTQTVVDLSKAGFIKKVKTQPKNGFEYNGKPITIGAYVKPYYRNNALKEVALTNYTVKYTKNNQLGIATVTFTSKNTKAFKGSIKTTFKIVPRKTPWKKIVMSKNSAQITVKTVNGSPYYQFQIRPYGKGNWKTVNSKKTTYKFTRLSKNRNYQLRVRAYKKVGKTTYYGNWNTITKKTTNKTYNFK